MNLKILLIDDDVTNSVFLKQFLEAEGLNVTYASDGIVGWELFQSERPNLILLDINMPGLNGFELAQRIRLTDQNVLIFFLSDRTGKDDRLRGFQLEGNDYIPKPFYPEELIAKIKERTKTIVNNAPSIYQLGDTVYNVNLSSIEVNGETTILSGRQNEILQILVRDLGKMVSRDLILMKVWGDDSFSNSMGLNVQINYLRRALSKDPSIAIETLRKRGYILKCAIQNRKN